VVTLGAVFGISSVFWSAPRRGPLLAVDFGGVDSNRVAVVRSCYHCFNDKDIDGVLDLCTSDVEFPDVVNDSVLRGRAAIEDAFRRQFEIFDHSVVLGDVFEVGEHVVVVAHLQVYERDGGPLGSGIAAVHRYSFDGERIAKVEWMGLDDVPEPVRERLV